MIQHPEAAAYQYHYTQLEERRKHAFAKFRQSFAGFPTIFSNCLIYVCATGAHFGRAVEANAIITQLQLPLTAQPNLFGAQNAFSVAFVEEIHC